MTDESAKLQLTVLGCGSSPGVPRLNGDWGNCDPNNPKNRRMRASLLVERITKQGRTTVVIDTGPDFRAQMLLAGVTQLDGVVYTHGHADHIHGIDDLRTFVFTSGHLMPVYADDTTFNRLREGFGYCFETPEGSSYPPTLKPHRIAHEKAFSIEGQGGHLTFQPLYQRHGSIHSLGFRIGDVAYCPDVSAIPDDTTAQMQNLDVLIIDALQYREHVSHFSIAQAINFIDQLKPKRAYLTHMHIPLDYETVQKETPDHVQPCYDGLVIEVE
ncbi:MAG: MBL fold metallo-hydrolase [Pseudomonadota bacterium]